MLNNNNCAGIYVSENAPSIISLLYADDLANCGDSVGRLQAVINVLEFFCCKWGLKINMSKTKVIVFRRGGIIKANEKWYFNGNEIEVVPHYKYLGIVFSSMLCWSKAVNTLCSQANKAICMLYNLNAKVGGLPIDTAFFLFDRTVLPIITYGAEIWGFQQYNQIENVQTKFCKRLLKLPKRTSDAGVIGECGRLPIARYYLLKCIKYWMKIIKMPHTRYVRACYEMIKHIDECNRITWATSVRKLLCKYGFSDVWVNQGVGDEQIFITIFSERLQTNMISDWSDDLRNQSRLSVYCTYKFTLEPEFYLFCLNIKQLQQAMARFRLGLFKLAIERGRWDGTLMQDRICDYCNRRGAVVLEDEYHFVLCCQDLQLYV
jgi:hypothetical protein